MTGYLSTWEFIALVVVSFGAFGAVWYIIAESRPKPRVTVEQEEAKARELAAHAPQWNGVPTSLEVHDYSDFDICDSTPESLSTFSRERGKAL